jgi:uncharacterized membrane-anchored protein YhcB (DUF1043 family)
MSEFQAFGLALVLAVIVGVILNRLFFSHSDARKATQRPSQKS